MIVLPMYPSVVLKWLNASVDIDVDRPFPALCCPSVQSPVLNFFHYLAALFLELFDCREIVSSHNQEKLIDFTILPYSRHLLIPNFSLEQSTPSNNIP